MTPRTAEQWRRWHRRPPRITNVEVMLAAMIRHLDREPTAEELALVAVVMARFVEPNDVYKPPQGVS